MSIYALTGAHVKWLIGSALKGIGRNHSFLQDGRSREADNLSNGFSRLGVLHYENLPRTRLQNKFENFYKDMDRRPSPDHSIERVQMNGNYEPSNCVWATRLVQANNKRNNRHLTHGGVTKTLAMWAREYAVNYKKFWRRIHDGWTFEESIA